MAGVPLGEVARRLGHSVETLVTTYAGVLAGDEALADKRIDDALAAPNRGASLQTNSPGFVATETKLESVEAESSCRSRSG